MKKVDILFGITDDYLNAMVLVDVFIKFDEQGRMLPM